MKNLVQRDVGALGVAFGLGLAPWVLGPVLSGRVEPWDGPVLPYLGVLVLAGFVPGWISWRLFWLWPLGVAAGQSAGFLVRMVVSGGGMAWSLWPLGLGMIGVTTLVPLAGSALGAWARRFIRPDRP